MFRVTGLWAAIGAAIAGIVIADVWTHPQGTTAAGEQIVSLEKNTGNQLLGSTAS
jgi:hypothetical protein